MISIVYSFSIVCYKVEMAKLKPPGVGSMHHRFVGFVLALVGARVEVPEVVAIFPDHSIEH